MDWTTIGGNVAAALTVIVIVVRLVRRDRKDQKLIRQINGMAQALSRCIYIMENGSQQEGSRDEHADSH